MLMATLEKRGKGSWRVGFQVRTPAGWQWVRKTVHVDPNLTDRQQRKEAERALARLQVEADEKGLTAPDGGHTVRSWSAVWLEAHVRQNCSPVTYAGYKRMISTRVLPLLGDVPLSKLTPVMLTDWLTQVRSSPRLSTRKSDRMLKNKRRPSQRAKLQGDEARTRPLSESTVLGYYTTLSAMLSLAVQLEVIDRNPMEKVTRPRVKKYRAHYLTEEQAVALLRCLPEEPNICYRAALLLALMCGLRLGEVSGLKLSDIDWDAGTIDISRARKYTAETGNYNAAPKSEASRRVIALPAEVMTVLQDARDYQDRCQQLVPHLWKGDGWIIHRWDGSQADVGAASRWFRRFADAHGFQGVRYHDLRHTHATLLLANGIDVVAVASRMGHGDPMVTLRTYAHVLARRDRDAAHVLDGLFGDVELPPPPRLPDDEK